MRALNRSNVISGLIIVCIGYFLLKQTSVSGNLPSGGFDPMSYPKTLLYILITLGILIIFSKIAPPVQQTPVLSQRTCLMLVILLAYGIGFSFLGFLTSSYLATIACALVMGWKRIPFLLGFNFVAIVGLWIMFRYLLKLPLPAGILI